MADISKCVGANCPVRNNCYRYTVLASSYQSYGDFQYDSGKCSYHWKV